MGLTSIEDIIKVKKHSNAHFMLIDGMSKLMTQKVKECESLDFHACGLTWKFVIRSDVVKDYLTSYLYLTDEQNTTGSTWGFNCSFKLIVVSQTGAPDISLPYECYFDSEHKAWGVNSLISQDLLKEKYLVNDKAVFSAEITGVTPKYLMVITTISPAMVASAERLKLMEVPRNNSRFTWKITQFSSFDGENHSSYEFTVGPRRWYLEMYPKGYLEGKGNSLSLFLHASDYVSNVPVAATSATYKLRVLDQHNRKHHEFEVEGRFTTNNSRWGFRKFLALEELHKPSNGYLVNNTIYIGVEFFFLSTHEYL